jgi:transcriptional regulator with XRE-family HTH domain
VQTYKLGWTQAEIGEKLGVARQTVSDILGEKRQMTDFAKNLPSEWNEQLIRQEAERLGIP